MRFAANGAGSGGIHARDLFPPVQRVYPGLENGFGTAAVEGWMDLGM